ncbi:MAG: hypothetical protein ACOYL6_07265 [Bacteriovoracaceae bacterium]
MKSSLELQAVSLPIEFTYLLTTDMASDQEVVSNVEKSFELNPVLKIVLGSTFSFANSNDDVGKWVRTLGWLHFRDRLGAIYINKLESGKYPYEVDSSLINDILELEHLLAPHTVQGVSRSYLLAFYISVHNRQHTQNVLTIPPYVFELLKFTGHKVSRIDYLVLLIWQLCSLLGQDQLEKILMRSGRDYQAIYSTLSIEQKEIMARNFLRYGFSINETDFFETRIN